MVESSRGSETKPNKLPAKQMLDLAAVKDLGSRTLQSPPLSTKASFFWQTMSLGMADLPHRRGRSSSDPLYISTHAYRREQQTGFGRSWMSGQWKVGPPPMRKCQPMWLCHIIIAERLP